MSLDTRSGTITWECDEPRCQRKLETGTASFEAARNMMLEQHWQPYYIEGDKRWKHRCDECTPKVAGGFRR